VGFLFVTGILGGLFAEYGDIAVVDMSNALSTSALCEAVCMAHAFFLLFRQ
jgi:hypothetical protein